MKNVLFVLAISAFGIATASAQTPTAAPTVAKKEVAKAADATKTAVQAAPAKVKTEAKKVAAATTATAATAKTEVKKVAEAPKTAVQTAPAATSTVVAPVAKAKPAAKKASVAKATTAKMMYKCPKGDALCDTGGKCPKCGTEMESMSAVKKTVAKAAAKPAAAKVEMKKEAVKQ